MKTFNKSLLAASIFAAASSAAAADGSLAYLTATAGAPVNGCEDVTCPSVSLEGIEAGVESITHDGVTVDFDESVAGMANISRIVVSLSGGEFSLSAPNTAGALTTVGASTEGWKFISENQIAWEFDTAADLSADAPFDITNLLIKTAGLGLGDTVGVTVTAEVDQGGRFQVANKASANAFQVVNQISFDTDGTIANSRGSDYRTIDAADRLSFVNGSSSNGTPATTAETLEDGVNAEVFVNDVNYAGLTAEDGSTITLSGDFAFVDADGDGEVNDGVEVSGGTFNEDFNELAATFDASDVNAVAGEDYSEAEVTFGFEFDGETEIPSLSATAEFDFNYSVNAGPIQSMTAVRPAIFWTLEGTSANFKYMPYGDNISQILFVTNNSSNDAVINVSARDDEGNTFSGKLDIMAKGNAVTKITGQVEDALVAAGFDGSGAVSLTITVNAGDVDFYGAYNVGGSDRGYVPAQ